MFRKSIKSIFYFGRVEPSSHPLIPRHFLPFNRAVSIISKFEMGCTFTPGGAATGSRASACSHNNASAHDSADTYLLVRQVLDGLLCTDRIGTIPGSPSDCWSVLDNTGLGESNGLILIQRAIDLGIGNPSIVDACEPVEDWCKATTVPYRVLGRSC
jgi:hypothetical protein